MLDPLALSQDLIRCPSITPEDAGALDVLETALSGLGFECHRLPFGEGAERVDNLWARIGSGETFCFAGHTDVVPVGDAAAWTHDPFGAEVVDGRLYGRGASDMKCAVACFAAAAARFLERRGPDFGGSIAFLITGDEEGPAINGTVKVMDWMAERGETIDACLVGEPTCPGTLGEMMKIGRRGSMNGWIDVKGVQGHVAYPQRADNPLPRLVRLLEALIAKPLDQGTDHFQASNLEITAIDTGNEATNVIPAHGRARFNVRFNDTWTPETLEFWLRELLARIDDGWEMTVKTSGVSFITPPGRLSDVIGAAAREVTGLDPELSTSGGTSDARFIKDLCPVVEFGMVGATAHKVDENVTVEEIENLSAIYEAVLDGYFPR